MCCVLFFSPVVSVKCHNLVIFLAYAELGSFGPSKCSDAVGKCFVTLCVTYLKPLPWYLSCSVRGFLMPGALQGIWGMKEEESSELCVPLSRDTGGVKCPVPRFILLIGDMLSFMRDALDI